MEHTAEVALLTRDPDVADTVLSVAAAAGVEVRQVTHAQGLRSGLLLVGGESAAGVRGVPPGVEVVLVGEDAQALGASSMALGARVVVLPEGRVWLTALLAGSTGPARATVVGLLGGCGGAGTSTLAAGLAQEAVARGSAVALLDADPGSPGLDLLLGAEGLPGWRWPALLGATGEVGDLTASVVRCEGLTLVSHARRGEAPGTAAVLAVLRSLARTHDVVVADLGRGGDLEVLGACDRVVHVVAARVAAVAAAGRGPAGGSRPGVVVAPGPLPSSEVAASLGMPLLASLPADPALPRGAEDGLAPRDAAGRRWRRAVAGLADAVLPGAS